MKVMGIDPGLAKVGYALIQQPYTLNENVLFGEITTLSKQPLSERLQTIYKSIRTIAAEHQPDAVALEDIFFAANVKTAVQVAQGRGVAILATAELGIELAQYTPLQIKMAVTGHGTAPKHQVKEMVRVILNLPEVPGSDHAADALAAAICHIHFSESAVPKSAAKNYRRRRRKR